MELNGAKILYTIHTDIPLLGDFKISQTLVSTWIVMALLSGLAIWLGSNLKLENVSKRQAAAEFIVERLDQFVHDNMGHHFDQYIPLIGAAVAIGNFAGICLVCQKVIDEQDEKRRKATLQASYNVRMLLQAVWIIVSIGAPCFQPFASVLPLLFPRVTIYYLQITGKYKPLAPAGPSVDVSVEDDPEPAPEPEAEPRDEGGET